MRRFILALTLAWLASSGGISAQSPELPSAAELSRSGQSFSLVPGVVVDPEQDALYAMAPDRRVVSIALSNGSERWSSEDGSKPLALFGNYLLTQEESGGQIAFLETNAGAAVASIGLDLPAQVHAKVDDSFDGTFEARAEVVDNSPIVSWQYQRRNRSGVYRGPTPVVRPTVGAARLDLVAQRALPTEPQVALASSLTLPPAARSWQQSTGLLPQRAGQLLVGIDRSRSGERAILKRWRASDGTELPDLELSRSVGLARAVSEDGRHLLISERVSPGQWNEYRWSFYSIDNGTLAGEVEHHLAMAPFFLSQDLVIFQQLPFGRQVQDRFVNEPVKVKALNLSSGLPAWDVELRDTTFRGQLPH